jgi:hypothetical protein
VKVACGATKSSRDESIRPLRRSNIPAGFFTYEDERLTVLAMLLENLGIDKAVQLGNLEDWKAAIAELQSKEHS